MSPFLTLLTPEGVPVYIKSPALSVINLETYEIISSNENIIFLLLPSCLIILLFSNLNVILFKSISSLSKKKFEIWAEPSNPFAFSQGNPFFLQFS
jgi:hypothetical protein